MINRRLAIFICIAASGCASDFQNGQAARAVIGQSTFSSKDSGLTPVALSLAGSYLYAADLSHRLFAFDLSRIPGPKDDTSAQPAAGCLVCGFSPQSSVSQSVMPGIAAVASFGNTVAFADAAHHRVLIWRDVTSPRATQRPDITLGKSAAGSVAADTLIEPVAVAYDGQRLFVADPALHRVLIWNELPVTDDQSADAVLGQPTFAASAAEPTSADTLRDPVALASDGTNLYVADSADHRILVFTPGDWPLSPEQVINAASLASGAFAPGTLITINVPGLVKSSKTIPEGSSDPAPRNLEGVEAYLDGEALPILAVSPTAVQTQLPFDLNAGSAASLYLRLDHNGGASVSSALALKIVPASPGLYAFGTQEPRSGLVVHSDANGTGEESGRPVTTESPAVPGETITLWATGLGPVDSADNERPVAGAPFTGEAAQSISPVAATVNGRPVDVVAAELPPSALGIYQVRIVLPPDLSPDPAAQLRISQNGLSSNTITFPLGPAS